MRMLRILQKNILSSCQYSGWLFRVTERFGANMSQLTSQKRPLEVETTASKRLCTTDINHEALEKIKKRKVVLLMGYCGQGYLGMQRNSGLKTIEEDLLKALLKAELIDEENFKVIQSMHFQRAARTDKGVSAVKQIVSLKLPENCSVAAINEHLPPTIRVFAMKRVTKGFNSKSSCDARTYAYLLPTYAFSVAEESEDYRITPDVIEKVKDALQVFTGTHNFHNFTAKKKAQDPSAFRYILTFECDEPFVVDGLEMICLRVKGQSFMLHQIRKMVGTVVAIVRGLTTKETIIKAWGETRLDLPMAPGLGLVLEEVHYDRYNTKFGQDGVHECLLWDEVDAEVQEFRRKYIDPVIVETEKTEKSTLAWIQTLPFHSYDVREVHALPADGLTKDSGESKDVDQSSEDVSEPNNLEVTEMLENQESSKVTSEPSSVAAR